MARTMITTTDNPFNYFTQFMAWKNYDEKVCNYYSLNYIGRIADKKVSINMSPKEMDQANEEACDEICRLDERLISPVTGEEVCYVKVTEEETDEGS